MGRGERPSMTGQLRFAHESLRRMRPLLQPDVDLLISHGNGPQVGQILTRVEAALGKAYAIPLEVCVAESEGELGYVLELALRNVLAESGITRPLCSLLTQVVVDESDPAFARPTKPIGMFYSAEQAEALRRQGFFVFEDAGRGYRRVVASPRPREILELDVIRELLSRHVLVIAAGGGGIPIVRREGSLQGVEAVIDKDLTGALLARELDADLLLILTDVPCAYRDYGQPGQQPIGRVTPDEVRCLIAAGQFAEGSMLPKMEAAVEFVSGSGRRAVICDCDTLEAALTDSGGTIVCQE